MGGGKFVDWHAVPPTLEDAHLVDDVEERLLRYGLGLLALGFSRRLFGSKEHGVEIRAAVQVLWSRDCFVS